MMTSLKFLHVLCLTLGILSPPSFWQSPPPVAAGGFSNTKCINLVYASSQSLSQTVVNFVWTNHAKFTVGGWVKRSATGTENYIWNQGNGSQALQIEFDSSNRFRIDIFDLATGNSTQGTLITSATYTSTTTWMHWMAQVDTANATANNRMRVWVDGTEISSFDFRLNPTTATFTSTDPAQIGGGAFGVYFSGRQDEVFFVDGQLTPVSSVITGTPGTAQDLTGISGLISWMRSDNGLTHDEVISAAWTNNGTATQATDAP